MRRADTDDAVYLAVVPDEHARFPRARAGEVGLEECAALAEQVRSVGAGQAIVAVVDVPSQAYGRVEELAGLHQAIAATVDAYHAARVAGHPVVAIVVGTALSGGFLAHGLQAARVLALDDPGVEVHAMHKPAAARITMRTEAQLDELAETVLPLSYDVRDWAQLGTCDALIGVTDADDPSDDDVAAVRAALDDAIERARAEPDLAHRVDVDQRRASQRVRDAVAAQWP